MIKQNNLLAFAGIEDEIGEDLVDEFVDDLAIEALHE